MLQDNDLNYAKINRWNLQKKQFASLFPVLLLAGALPAINYFLIMLIVGAFLGTAGVVCIGFFSPVFSVVAAVHLILGTGLQIMCGRFLGKGDFAGIRGIFSTGMAAAVFIGAVLGGLSFCCSMDLAGLLGATGEVRTMVAEYLKGFAPNFILMVTGSCLIMCLQMDNARKFAAGAIGIFLLSNALLSIVFLLVYDLGMFGIGLAASFSNLFLNCIALIHIRNSRIFVFSSGQISRSAFYDIVLLGINSGFANILIALRSVIFNHLVFALGGMVAMSAMTVAMCISNTLGGCIECGLYDTTAIITSVLMGERDILGLRRLHKNVAVFISPFYVMLYVLIFVFAGPIALLFGAEPANLPIYVLCIRIYNLWFLANFLKSPATSIYNALGHTKILFVFTLLGFLFFPLLIMGLGKYFGSIGVTALILLASDMLTYVSAVIYYRIKAGRFPTGFFNICYIPNDFVASEDVFAYSAKTGTEAVEGAKKLTEFCLQHGMNDKLSKVCSLCFEEVVIETISRFPEKKRENYSVEVHGLFEKGHLSLMFHDNLPEFDPRSVLKFYNPQHPETGVGMRMVVALAKEVQYNFTVGLNSLTVKL